jgi:hypothetical protein
MTTRAHLQAVTAWISKLANVTAGAVQVSDIEGRIAGLAAMLAEDFPDIARFTPESLRGVAAECNSFPPYAKLKALIDAYWQQHRQTGGNDTPPVGSGSLAQADMSPEDRMGVTVWLQRLAENKLPKSDMVMRLAVIRRYHAKGYRWLIANNDFAKQIAADKGWHEPETRRAPPTDEEQEAIAALIRNRPTTTTNAAGEKQTTLDAVDPDPTHQVDATVVARLAAKAEAQKGRKLGQLDPATLEALRKQNGLLHAAQTVTAAAKAEQERQSADAQFPNREPEADADG